MAIVREIRVIWDMWVIVNKHVIATECLRGAHYLRVVRQSAVDP